VLIPHGSVSGWGGEAHFLEKLPWKSPSDACVEGTLALDVPGVWLSRWPLAHMNLEEVLQ
jgi:hypothetical protein